MRIKRWSIADKMTVNYTAAAVIILFIISVVLSIGLNNMMATAEKQYLVDEYHIIKSIFQDHPNNKMLLEQEVNGVPSALKDASYYYFLKIISENKIFMQTPGTDAKIKQAPFPTGRQSSNKFVYWTSSDGVPYLLMTAPLNYDSHGQPKFSMQMALDISYPKKLIMQYRLYIAMFFLFFVGVFVAIGKSIAKSALRSIEEMAKVTERITSEKLFKRLNHSEWPKELKSLGSSFNTMISGIELAFNRLSQCTNELAHELRLPINNLIGSTEITLSRERSVQDYKLLLASNLDEFRRISKLADTILFLARAEIPESSISAVPIYLSKEVAAICEFYQYAAAEKQITLEYSGDGIIQGDLLMFQRALTNLIHNAINYTLKDGKIWVQIVVAASHCNVVVTDTGIGIAPEDLTFVFDRFYKGKQAINVTKNFGLGLAIVNTIMKLHGGQVTVTSQQNVGSTFTLHFPKV